jgi:hypothetical protein
MNETRNMYKILGRTCLGKWLIGKPRRWKDNIKVLRVGRG